MPNPADLNLFTAPLTEFERDRGFVRVGVEAGMPVAYDAKGRYADRRTLIPGQ
jgi:hypothetical protein